MPRGRRTIEETLCGFDGPLIPGARPPAPPELAADEAAIWNAVANRMPGDYFPIETHPLLKQYCRHAALADVFGARIADMRSWVPGAQDGAWLKEINALGRALGFQSAVLALLSQKLRLAHSSRFSHQRAAVQAAQQPGGLAPWQDWGSRAKRDDDPKSN